MAENVKTLIEKKNKMRVKSFVERATSSISQLNLFVTVPTPSSMSSAHYTTGQQMYHHHKQQQQKSDACLGHLDLTTGGSKKAYYRYQMNEQDKPVIPSVPKRKTIVKNKNRSKSRRKMKKAEEKQNNNKDNNQQQTSSKIPIEAEKTSLVELLRALPIGKKIRQITPAIHYSPSSYPQDSQGETDTNKKDSQVKTPQKIVVAFVPRVIEVQPYDCYGDSDNNEQSITSDITEEEEGRDFRTLSDTDDDSECSGDSNRIDGQCLRRNNIKIDGLFLK